jgi:outer membrane protein TolC
MMLRRVLAVAVALMVGAPLALQAQDSPAPTTGSPPAAPTGTLTASAPPADSLLATDLCTAEDCPVLDLETFLERVLQSNPEVQSLRLEDDRAAAQLLDARGGFDPRLVSGYEYKTQDNAAKLNVLRTGLRLPLDLPMSPQLKLDYRRGAGSSIDPSVSTSAVGETRLGVAVAPLSGLFINKEQAALSKARLEPRRTDAVQAERRNQLLLDATQAYWKWVEARRKLQISQDLLALATRRQDLITRRARAGEAAAIDSTEAELLAVSRRGTVAEDLRAAKEAGVKLATFLWNPDGTPAAFQFAPPALPDAPAADRLEADTLTVAQATDRARARRPELQALAVKQRQTRIEQQLQEAQLRPDLKLEAQAVSYDSSPLNVTDVKLGFSIEQPLFFRGGRGDVEQARIETQQLAFKQDLTRRKVRADVEAAVVALRQARQQVAAAERRVELARRLQEAEQRRFELGESTLFLLNQREQAFAEARKALVSARVDVLRALATYRWATGTIADAYRAAGR